ncbi:DNA-directed RNA polymerase III subunit RPC3 [Cimex lectularius]|uniref:DNA-directed RNA polymerase III subunit RPC3 n=1 Tax=Cimex lectularius TaxID=79782 RepID=A0A8I6TLK6_CIMLE|nr:DNA-directed RNA polymerase III subunit RPC3 [Cimex lectularius]
MSLKYGQLCSLLIQEHFGPIAEKIHQQLQWGPKTFKLLASSIDLPPPLLRRVLCILIQYGFVVFESRLKPQVAEYRLLPDKILLLLRYPRYLSLINDKYGEISRLIIDEVLQCGCISAPKLILNVWTKIQDGALAVLPKSMTSLSDALHRLIQNQYLMRCPSPSEDGNDRVPKLVVNESELYKMPEIDVPMLLKLWKGETSLHSIKDHDILWRCNFDRFHQDMRDEIMVEGIRRRFDSYSATFMEVALNQMYLRTEPWATQSNPVPLNEIREEVDKKSSHLAQFLDQYIKVIDEDSCSFIKKIGEGSTASVYVNLVAAFSNLTAATIESVVEHRFGCKAARIFRLVRSKKFIDQEQLQKIAMIPDKEAKQLTYRLLQESFLHMQELKKSATAGLNKNFYLFHVDFNQVVHVVLEMCYKAIYNTLKRANHEKNENLRMIDKFEKLNSVAQTMKQQGEDEQYIKQLLDEWMTPPEKSLMESVEATIKKLRLAELYLDETIFLLQLYIYYDATSSKEIKL